MAALTEVPHLNNKVGSLSEDRNALESGLVVLGQHMGGRINALEWENAELNSRLGEADKVRASLELELKSAKSCNEQLVKSQEKSARVQVWTVN